MTEASSNTVEESPPNRRVKTRLATVTSAKVEKTVTVTVDRRVKHPRYGKYITRLKKYSAHDELGCQQGDRVRIEETRPLSKTKRWKVVEKLGRDR